MSSGRLQIVAAALIAASAWAAPACAADPIGSWRAFAQPGAVERTLAAPWIELEMRSVAPVPFPTALAPASPAPRLGLAGATLRDSDGWSASLFVSQPFSDTSGASGLVRFGDATAVNARLSRRLSGTTRVTLDLFNLLDRREAPLDDFVASNLWSSGGVPEDFLVHPGEPRGIRLGIRRTFR